MSRPRLAALLVAALVLGAACRDATAPDGAPSLKQSGPKFVPFKATIEAVLGPPIGTCPNNGLMFQLQGTGHATHMGRITVEQTQCVSLTTLAYAGEFRYTAANGDQIFGVYSGQATPTATPNIFSLAGTFTITGGTGRFAGATGGGTAIGVGDNSTGLATATLDGVISSVGSSK